VAGVGDALKLQQVFRGHRAPGQQRTGVVAALVEQLAQLLDVAAGVSEVGEPVERGLVALVGERAQGFVVGHAAIVQPCPWGNVKCDDGGVLTIGQLAGYVGVTTKTIRVYHAKGLLPEPPRDASGYRRYTAADAVELIKIRTLAEAGVPLARIRELRSGGLSDALRQIDDDLATRIRGLQATRERLRQLADGRLSALPADVVEFLSSLPGLGFSERWVALQNDLWLLVFATHPETARTNFRDQSAMLADPALLALVLEYDRVHDLDPHDPRVESLAERLVTATRARYGAELPSYERDSAIPALVQSAVNASSPAWRRLDALIRERLSRVTPDPPS
jgi:DNA-binding transcriptional MerR regulator